MRFFQLILFVFALITSSVYAQSLNQARIAFYNLENLFDIYDDSLTNDDEFTFNGSKKWNKYRYEKKLLNIYKVIINMGDWEPPAIVGLCEVENYWVLHDLINKTPLGKFDYKIIHKESPDDRGIDAALLYLEDKFRPFHYNLFKLDFPTREILYIKGHLFSTDTIHLFVNHWPSRWGGKMVTEQKRIAAASLLKNKTDSVLQTNPDANIILMGDFNDEPKDKSISEILNATFLSDYDDGNFINLMEKAYRAGKGTITVSQPFFQWFIFDQLIVSKSLIKGASLSIENDAAHIFNPSWLLDKENKRPFRTFRGPVYLGGYSDHLPVYLDIKDIK